MGAVSQLVGENEPVMVKHEWSSYITGEGQTDPSDLLYSIAPLLHTQPKVCPVSSPFIVLPDR